MNIQANIEKIKELETLYMQETPKSESKTILYDMVMAVKRKTSNYQNPFNISTEKQDIRPYLVKEGVDIETWIRTKGTDNRSEAESIEWLIAQIQNEFGTNKNKSEMDKKRLRISIKARAVLALQMMEAENN